MLQGDSQENWSARQMPVNDFSADSFFGYRECIDFVKRKSKKHLTSANQVLMQANIIKKEKRVVDDEIVKQAEVTVLTRDNYALPDTAGNVSIIIDAACNACDVSLEQLSIKARPDNIVAARRIVSLFVRWHAFLGALAVGKLFKRDHSSIIHLCSSCCNELEKECEPFFSKFHRANNTLPEELKIIFNKDESYLEQFKKQMKLKRQSTSKSGKQVQTILSQP